MLCLVCGGVKYFPDGGEDLRHLLCFLLYSSCFTSHLHLYQGSEETNEGNKFETTFHCNPLPIARKFQF